MIEQSCKLSLKGVKANMGLLPPILEQNPVKFVPPELITIAKPIEQSCESLPM